MTWLKQGTRLRWVDEKGEDHTVELKTEKDLGPGPLEVIPRHREPRMRSLVPTTLEDTLRLCEQLAKSELVPQEFRGKPANVFVAIQLGADLGITPMQALQSIAVFNGKPTIYGDLGLALALNSGLLDEFDEWYDADTKTAHCKARRRGGKDVERTFGQADAERAQVWNQNANKMVPLASRGTYQSYPRRMHQMRARWWALRDVVPDVFNGLIGREEIEDDDLTRQPRDMGAATRVAEEDNPLMPRQRPPAEVRDDSPSPSVAPGPVSGPPTHPGAGGGDSGHVPHDLPSAPDLRSAVHPGPSEPADPPGKMAPVESGERTTVFELNGQRFATAGVTRAQMLELFKLCPQVNRKRGKNFDKDLLRKEFCVDTRADLTAEKAEQYRIRLQECLEG